MQQISGVFFGLGEAGDLSPTSPLSLLLVLAYEPDVPEDVHLPY